MDVNNLITQLENNPSGEDSTVMLVNTIAAQVMADANNPQALLALTQELQQRSNDIAAAVNANVQRNVAEGESDAGAAEADDDADDGGDKGGAGNARRR